jgi:multidrug efflux pump
MFAAQDIRTGGRQSDLTINTRCRAPISTCCKQLIVGKRMETVEGITDVSSAATAVALSLVIDRKTASSLGVRQDTTRPEQRSRSQISIVYTQRPVHGGAGDRSKFRAIRRTWSASSSPAPMTRSAAIRCRGISARPSPLACFTRNRSSTTVSFNVLPDAPLEVATTNISARLMSSWPEGIRGSFDGNAGDFNKTSGRQPLLIGRACGDVYCARRAV